MNIHEAINHFKYGITHDIFSEPITNYVRMAIDALEKQIPKKPIEDLNNIPHYHCPNCNNGVAKYKWDYKYPCCQWCGVKLLWE